MVSIPLKSSRFGFAVGWAMVTVIGFAISWAMFAVGERSDLGLWQGLLGGGTVGLLQSLVLMRYGIRSPGWVLATALAWGLAGVSAMGVVGWFAPVAGTSLLTRVLYGAWEGLRIGAWLGFWQWLSLRSANAKLPTSWMFWSAGIWMIGLMAGWFIGGELRLLTNLFVSEVVGLVVAWMIVGAIAGLILGRLLRITAPSSAD
ncbi:MAG: hypothetical protein ACFB0C_08455 [Leptolyngbyaceae cyanobacterium]